MLAIGRMTFLLGISLSTTLLLTSTAEAQAQRTAPGPTAAPSPTPTAPLPSPTAVPGPPPQQPAAPVQAATEPSCAAEPNLLAKGNLKLTVSYAAATAWQPVGSEVQFTVTGAGMPSDDMKTAACFRWHRLDGKGDWRSTQLRVIKVDTGSSQPSVTFGARVPDDLQKDHPNFWDTGSTQKVVYTGLGLVPVADLHVVMTSTAAAWSRFESLQPVGITSITFSLILALLASLAAWLVFLGWGTLRNVKGGPILRVISSRNGVASLSQLQIMIWTFVIGAGVMYVMALSGSMIDIPATMLGLLGISGLAAVGAKIQAGASAPNQPSAPPGAVTGLSIVGAATNSSVVLNWTPPSGADPTFVYTVQYRNAGTMQWSTAASAVAAPPYAVTGLTPNTGYEFQVFAVNAKGAGPASQPLQVSTAAAAATPVGAPAQVTGLQAAAGPDPTSQMILTWALLPRPNAYTVQYRSVGTLAWATASGTADTPYTVTGLDSNTAYEFRVFAVTGGLAGMPSDLVTFRTAVRTPQWSDLVVTGDGSNEIDVTRVQMLLFTLIAAVFVTLKLIDSSQVPEIPAGILTLIGISNGVYLTAKYVPGPR